MHDQRHAPNEEESCEQPFMRALRPDPPCAASSPTTSGVGKTIEAGLSVRELWEQAELRGFAVLCPSFP